MKNLILITIAIFTLQTVTAQRPEWTKKGGERPEYATFIQDFSAEQMATLQAKRMTLQLDLSESQINKVYNINLKATTKRKAKIEEMKSKKQQGKPSATDRYKMMTRRLDSRIVYKNELSKVLSKEQLEKWTALANEHFGKSGHFMDGKPNFARGNNKKQGQ